MLRHYFIYRTKSFDFVTQSNSVITGSKGIKKFRSVLTATLNIRFDSINPKSTCN